MKKEYVCIRACHHGPPPDEKGNRPTRRLYSPGDKEWFGDEPIPSHFIPLAEYSPPGPPKKEPLTLIKGIKAPIDPDYKMKLEAKAKAKQDKEKAEAKK
jgi:hypothetical protein